MQTPQKQGCNIATLFLFFFFSLPPCATRKSCIFAALITHTIGANSTKILFEPINGNASTVAAAETPATNNALRMWISTPTGALLFVTILINMLNSKNSTEGETSRRTLVIFRDCHAKNNITVPLTAGGENFPKKDCGNEKTTIFAAPYITKSGETASETRADFLFPPTPIRCSTPSPSVNAPAALRECKAEGKAAPLFLPRPQQKTSEMPYTEKDCASANKSNGCAAQAVQNAARRTLVIFRDCHAKNNIVVPIDDSYTERFYRNFARRMGWKFTVRKVEKGVCV